MKRVLLFGVGAVALLVGVAVALVLVRAHQGRNVRGSPTVEFVPTETAAAARPRRNPTPWPTYGYDAARLRVAPGVALRPPFRREWTFHGRALLEFPPAVAYDRVYQLTFDGRLYALDAVTGKTRWQRHTGRCGWASPAVSGGIVYVALIGHACNERVPGRDGVVLALDARSGRLRWRRTVGPVESSPLVARGRVYVGDWNGGVYALDQRTGRTRWRYQAGGPVKGSLALSGRRVFVGAYDGRVYALAARSGRLLWRASSQPRLGAHGTFYSTPAAAYGRIYIGSTDGKVYSFGQTSGKLRWSQSTGGYVYASPAVWKQRVLVGSYDHRFYAFDAATGAVDWSFDADGPISGAATVVAGLVYFSTFAETTYALDARTGRLVWRFPDGKYSPVVADRMRLYLVGLGRLFAMAPAR